MFQSTASFKRELARPIGITGIVPHHECEYRWRSKCRWEHMSMMAILSEWPDIICADCKQYYVDHRKVYDALLDGRHRRRLSRLSGLEPARLKEIVDKRNPSTDEITRLLRVL